jgi:hypothetical protein
MEEAAAARRVSAEETSDSKSTDVDRYCEEFSAEARIHRLRRGFPYFLRSNQVGKSCNSTT